MQVQQLGKTNLRLTRVGFGSWAIGGDGWEYSWGPQDDADSIATLHKGLDLGINWIDTAPAYGLGRSEEVVGRAIKGRRDDVLIATKCGLEWDDAGNVRRNCHPDRIRQEVADSLRRLDVDVIDLYQIHWPDPAVPLADAWGTMADLVTEGKVRYIGVSNFDVPQMEAIQAIHPIASLQPPYSLLRRGIEAEILPYCHANNIGVIPYSPMLSGLLTGKFDPDRLAPDDWRRRDFTEQDFAQAVALTDALRPIAKDAGRTVAQLAVAWVNAQPGVTAAIVGARRPSQIEETVQAGKWMLTPVQRAAVNAALAAL